MLFPYNRADDAWKWMKYIGDVKDNAHEVAAQGTNGDYPEISYTLVSQFVEGMMGVEPNVADGIVATSPRLPQEIGDLAVENITFGDFTIDLAMEGNQKTVLTNHSEKSISWEARFYGDYDYIIVNGVARTAKHKQMNGETISYIRVSAGSGKMVTAQASDR
jgi:hypothetical protein